MQNKHKKEKSRLIETKKSGRMQDLLKRLKCMSEKEIVVLSLEGISITYVFALMIRYVWVFFRLDAKILCNNVFFIILMGSLPLLVWIYATGFEFWSYRNRKLFFLSLYLVAAILTATQPVYTILWKVITPVILTLKPNQVLTKSMILWTERVAIFLPLGCVDAFLLFPILRAIHTKEGKERVYRFKLSKIADTRKNRENLYDFKGVVKDLYSGEPIVLQEEDLRTAVLLNGPSGTGKTSSVIIPTVRDVMDQKIHNKLESQKEIAKLLEEEKAMIASFDASFLEKSRMEENYVERMVLPTKSGEAKFEKIRETYKNAGITIMAPNNGYIKDVLRLAKARKIKVNVLDPAYDWSKDYPGTAIPMKINPFYIPEGLSEEEQNIAINNRASVFSEVLVALNEQNKESDIYFKDINLSMTSNIAAVVMAANYYRNKQTEILEVQACIDNPSLLTPYIKEIEKHAGFEFQTSLIATKPPKSEAVQNLDKEKDTKAVADRLKNKKENDAGAKKEEIVNFDKVNAIVERNRTNPLYRSVQFIKDEVLSEEGRQKMYDQARGLRNLLSIKLLNDTRITDILSAKTEEELLDFDRILENGEVTVVNTAVEFASGLSTAFGLFFQLNLKTAVFRRNPRNKLNAPHFLIIDEVSQYVHPFYNDIVSFYRQYNIISCLSIQSLSQLASKESTKYLKELFQSIGTHIVYGRLSGAEMKIYEEMAGQNLEEMVQATYSYNSLFSANPSITQSDRVTPNLAASMTGSDMRYRDFQEVVVFTSQGGDVLKPIAAKVSFTSEMSFHDVDFPVIHWERFVPEKEAPMDYESGDEKILEKQETVRIEPVQERVEILTQDGIERKKEEKADFEETVKEAFPNESKEDLLSLFDSLLSGGKKNDDAV